MKMKIKKGCNIPISGAITDLTLVTKQVKSVAVYGPDYEGMKPSMMVKEGDTVKSGQPLFSCKKTDGVIFTSPISGRVKSINRGKRRFFQSLVIENDGAGNALKFECKDMNGDSIRKLLLESGEWCGLRSRPYSKVADPASTPSSIFVTAIDTNPLSIDPFVIIERHIDDFELGLKGLSKIASINLCVGGDKEYKTEWAVVSNFSGVHPAGNVGTHIHFIDPVYEGKLVWHIGYQNVIAIGHLLRTSEIWSDRYVALTGPEVKTPKLILTLRGANLDELIQGELKESKSRVVSGSILNGHMASDAAAYLGYYHNQVTVIDDREQREFLGWAMPGISKFSLSKTFLASLIGQKKFTMNTLKNGGHRAIVSVGIFEKIMPLDFLATPLLKALASKDVEQAQRLGCLELDEEDLALCTFACNGKNDYGSMLRECLTIIEREG